MNDYLQAIVLGAVQGVSEFLPISSDGHLVIAKHLLSWASGRELLSSGLEFEVFLHIGTLFSILVVYAKDLWRQRFNMRQWGLVIVASIPAAIVGLTLKDWFEAAFNAPVMAGYGFLVTAALLAIGHYWERPRFEIQHMPWIAAVIIGCFQAIAPLPGVSRSGSTISGGLLCGLDRISATKFSFLMAIPITAGAILVELKDAWKHGHTSVALGPTLVGITVSFSVGCLALRVLIRLMTQRKLHWFALYCLVLGIATIVIASS